MRRRWIKKYETLLNSLETEEFGQKMKVILHKLHHKTVAAEIRRGEVVWMYPEFTWSTYILIVETV